MHHIVYQSVAFANQSPHDLKVLLKQSRANNARLNITGLLLYSNGNFLQVLEGEKNPVHQLYEVIKADFRHTDIVTLSDGTIEARTFTNWTMGFQALSGYDFSRLAGYINPFRSNFPDAHLPLVDESVLGLLKSFVQTDYPRF